VRTPPRSEPELLARARELAGLTLGEVAAGLGEAAPADARRAKGWAGALLERALGADARSMPEPDFTGLGIELKTVPITRHGRPRESTYVCTVPLEQLHGVSWETSLVRRKLARVLWVPVLVEPGLALAGRRLGTPLLWSPDGRQQAQLQADWNELMDLLALGQADRLHGALGEVLQVRPKAADGRARRGGFDAEGRPVETLPRGFYLRSGFTAGIIAAATTVAP